MAARTRGKSVPGGPKGAFEGGAAKPATVPKSTLAGGALGGCGIGVDMRPEKRNRPADAGECARRNVGSAQRVIAGLASKQHGVVSRAQLRTAGVEPGWIKRAVRSGRLHPVHRGVYLVGHTALAPGARELAAVLASGSGAVVSHRSAACLWQLLPFPADPLPVDITIPGRDAGKRLGIRAHRVQALADRDIRVLDRIPVTSPARTIRDLAAILSSYLLERVVADAQARRLVREKDLVNQLHRHPRRPGTPALRNLIELERGPALTRSEAERRLLRLVRAAGFPAPETNARVGPYEVDFLWRAERVVVEIDGFRFHSSRVAFERDRERDTRLTAAGYAVLRFTWRQLVSSPEAVVARLAAALTLKSS